MSRSADPRTAGACDAVIVNYNAGDSLRRAVTSAIDSGVGRVIVVDNGSQDGSLDLLGDRTSSGAVTILRNGRNLGFAAACNLGLARTAASEVLFLNPDCTLSPGALARLREVLRSDPTIGMVGGRLCDPDGTEQRGGRRRFPTPANVIGRAFTFIPRRWLGDDFMLHETPLPDGPVDVDAISGACMLVSRDALAEVGGWDDGYFLHCEDLDWCRQFAAHGQRVVFVPDALVLHEKGVSSRSRPVFVEWHKHRGMLRFFRKWQRREHGLAVAVLVTAGVWVRFATVASMQVARRLVGRDAGRAHG